MRLKDSSLPASMYASMEPRSSRLLSGRRVPSRHSARFISRSALAIAIDALPPFSAYKLPDAQYMYAAPDTYDAHVRDR